MKKPVKSNGEVAWGKDDAKGLAALIEGQATEDRVAFLAQTLETSQGAIRNMLAATYSFKRDGVTPVAKSHGGLHIHSELADRARALIAGAGQHAEPPKAKRSHHKKAEAETGLRGVAEPGPVGEAVNAGPMGAAENAGPTA